MSDMLRFIQDAEALDKRQRECEHPYDAIEHIRMGRRFEQVNCKSCHKVLYFHAVEPD
jgi:hypothetical protein